MSMPPKFYTSAVSRQFLSLNKLAKKEVIIFCGDVSHVEDLDFYLVHDAVEVVNSSTLTYKAYLEGSVVYFFFSQDGTNMTIDKIKN